MKMSNYVNEKFLTKVKNEYRIKINGGDNR